MDLDPKDLLKNARKEITIKNTEVDQFIGAKSASVKYFIENTFERNRLFRYLLLLRINGLSIDTLMNKYIKLKGIKRNKKRS